MCVAWGAVLWPSEAAAQRRVVRRAPTRVVVSPGFRAPYYRSYYRPYYRPFYTSFYSGWSSWDPYYQYPRYPVPYGWYPRYYEPGADLRIQVTQRQAEVFVDGYYTGTVDDFDGALQRLRVPLGEHEITIYLDGYRPIRQKMLFRPGETYKIQETLQPLASGEPAEPRPSPSEPRRQDPRDPQDPQIPERAQRPQAPPERPDAIAPDRGERTAFGTLAIRVQPAGAEMLVDGQRWDGPEGDRLSVEVEEGSHRVEIRKEGFKPYTSIVRVRRGETVQINVSLPRDNP